MVQPVIHHVELCVRDTKKTVKKLRRYGLRPFATRENAFCKQIALKLNNIYFIVTQKASADSGTGATFRGSIRDEPLTAMCSRCENECVVSSDDQHVDTVFNIALNVKNVKKFFSRASERINCGFEKCVIQAPTMTQDEFGKIEYCIIKSPCGNVIHVCLNKDDYKGDFLPGFKMIEGVDDIDDVSDIKENVTHIDHITLACHGGFSENIIQFYKECFGMEKISISNKDDENDGLILKEGVGLRLRAMEFYKCSETGLICPTSTGERTPNSLMLVVVESLPGEKNCNIETFLQQHQCPGVEHLAFATKDILSTVWEMRRVGVDFRLPPECYYEELRRMPQIQEITDLNLDQIAKHGILLDREEDLPELNAEPVKPKYLMQIFAMPLFDLKTFFIEVIQRHGGARGLGSGNIVALVKSIREDEKRKAAEKQKSCYQRCADSQENGLRQC